MNNIGKFIAFEGIDGSGKSTQIRLLKEKIEETGVRCFETREPTDSPVGSIIRNILTGRIKADNRVIASLFVADRVDHLVNSTDGIVDKINNGITVLTDRYYFSNYAYNCIDSDMDWLIQANSISTEILRPTVTVFLDLPISRALERISKNRFHTELFEKEERLKMVREKYFEAFKKLENEEKVIIINADSDVKTISEEIWKQLKHLFVF